MATHSAALRVRAGINRSTAKVTKGKGWRTNWRDRTNVPREKPQDEDGFLFVPGVYEDRHPRTLEKNGGKPGIESFFVRQVHRIALHGKGKNVFPKSTTCRRFYDGSGCLACDELEQGNRKVDNGKKGQDGHVKSGYSVNCIEFGLFELKPATKQDGTPVLYESDSAPDAKNPHRRGDQIMQWERVIRPKDRNEILAVLEEEIELGNVCLYKKKYMDLGPGHLSVLTDVDNRAAEFCKSCGTGHLEVTGFECASCHELLLDVYNANLTTPEMEEYSKTEQRCASCGHTDLAQPLYDCDTCKSPDPYRWFEVVAQCRKTGKDAQTIIAVEKVTPVDQFELADGSYLVKADKNGDPLLVPMDPADPDGALTFVYEEEFARLIENQFNFEEVHRPESNDEIAKWLEIRNPYASTGAGGAGSGRAVADDEEPPRRGRGGPGPGRGRAGRQEDAAPSRGKEPVRRQR